MGGRLSKIASRVIGFRRGFGFSGIPGSWKYDADQVALMNTAMRRFMEPAHAWNLLSSKAILSRG